MNPPDVADLRIANRRATRQLARALAKVIGPGDLVLLDGQLGAGKTFFVRALCRALGLDARVRVTSPTFSLVHEIATVPRICHADLYRLATRRDVLALGLLERRDDGEIIIAEWSSPWLNELGGDGLVLEFAHEPRSVRLRHTGRRSATLMHALLSDASVVALRMASD